MKRTLAQIKVDAGKTRYKVRLEDDPSEPDTADSRIRQAAFMAILVNTPELMSCGPGPWQRCNLYHTGTSWVAELEALFIEE